MDVFAILGDDSAMLGFVVGNHGERAALEVKFEFMRDVEGSYEALSDSGPFATGIDYLAPGRARHFEFSPRDGKFFRSESEKHILDLTASYKGGSPSLRYEERVHVDLAFLDGMSLGDYFKAKGTFEKSVAGELKDIKRELKRIADSKEARR